MLSEGGSAGPRESEFEDLAFTRYVHVEPLGIPSEEEGAGGGGLITAALYATGTPHRGTLRRPDPRRRVQTYKDCSGNSLSTPRVAHLVHVLQAALSRVIRHVTHTQAPALEDAGAEERGVTSGYLDCTQGSRFRIQLAPCVSPLRTLQTVAAMSHPIATLPDELMVVILAHLPVRLLLRARLVSARWRRLAETEQLWTGLLRQWEGSPPSSPHASTPPPGIAPPPSVASTATAPATESAPTPTCKRGDGGDGMGVAGFPAVSAGGSCGRFVRECQQTARWRLCSARAGRRFTAADGYDKTLRAVVVNGQLVTTHWDKLSGVGGAVRVSRTATSTSSLEPFLTNLFLWPECATPHAPCGGLYLVPMRAGLLIGACDPTVCPIHVFRRRHCRCRAEGGQHGHGGRDTLDRSSTRPSSTRPSTRPSSGDTHGRPDRHHRDCQPWGALDRRDGRQDHGVGPRPPGTPAGARFRRRRGSRRRRQRG